jgi:glycosyltransferase involved in cell wall biosynthesis
VTDLRSLRIAHVTATFPPYYAGTGNVCYHNVRVLAARGHDVHVFTPSWPGRPSDPDRVAVHRLGTWTRMGNASVLRGLGAGLTGFDVVHLHCPFIGSGELVAALAKARSCPLVVTYHNDLIGIGVRGLLFRAYQNVSARAILAAADRVCAVTAGHAASAVGLRRLVAAADPRLVLLPNGVDTQVFNVSADGLAVRDALGIPRSAFAVAFVGVLDAAHYFKRLDLLLRALAACAVPDPWLLVVGEGELLGAHRREAEKLGIADRARFVGAVAQRELPPYLAAADVLVLPSTGVESFGMVLIEAMAVGHPVVASDLPGVRSVVADGVDGFLVPPGDVGALADALDRLYRMPVEDRAALGAAGRRKVVAEYDWERIGDRLEALYRSVLSGPRRSKIRWRFVATPRSARSRSSSGTSPSNCGSRSTSPCSRAAPPPA